LKHHITMTIDGKTKHLTVDAYSTIHAEAKAENFAHYEMGCDRCSIKRISVEQEYVMPEYLKRLML